MIIHDILSNCNTKMQISCKFIFAVFLKPVPQRCRLLWQDDAHVRCGLSALRARAAACLRIHDDSGFFLAGALLAERCQKQTNGIELRA